ncbi:hypothetical protein [Bradyrhizobium genosp. P]|uniref:hypothetical protein n=1 Tax=Bradyrhizobium genosp. P TaxID=83641 RepID=UPI003CED5D37
MPFDGMFAWSESCAFRSGNSPRALDGNVVTPAAAASRFLLNRVQLQTPVLPGALRGAALRAIMALPAAGTLLDR